MGTWRFNILVVVFWAAATTWLVYEKVRPQWKRGNPPPYLVSDTPDELVCWTIEVVPAVEDPSRPPERFGWAASRVIRRIAGRSEIQTRVQLLRVPRSIVKPLKTMLGRALPDLDRFELGLTINIQLDNQSKLTRFVSAGFMGDTTPLFTITGVNNDGELEVSQRMEKREPQVVGTYWLGDTSAMNDAFAPHDRVPDLQVGRTWKSQQFSSVTFAGIGNVTSEALEAEVMRVEEIVWDGKIESCWLVEFHRDSGAGSKWAETPLRRMWVRLKDDRVLREDIMFLGWQLRYARLPPNRAQRLSALLEKSWSAPVLEHVIVPDQLILESDKTDLFPFRPAPQPTSATSH